MLLQNGIPFPMTPIGAMFSSDVLSAGSRGASNNARPHTFTRNLYGTPYGPRQAGTGPTVTLGFADGPTKTGTATRVLCSLTTHAFSFYASGFRPPAGTYTIRFKVKSNSGSDAAIRYGNSTAGYSNATALAASWTTCEKQFTTNGTDYSNFVLTGDGANTPDLLVDEVQFYNDTAANVPDISTELLGDDFIFPIAYPLSRFSGKVLDNSTASILGSGLMRLPNYPATTAISELTVICVASSAEKVANQMIFSTDQNSTLGTTATTMVLSQAAADGSMDATGVSVFAAHDMQNQGLFLVGMKIGAASRSLMLDSIEMASTSAVFAGFNARVFRIGSNGTAESLFQTTYRWRGNIAAAVVFDRALSDAEYKQACRAIRARVQSAGISLGSFPAFMIAMGDSQTASFTGTRGPSWAVLQAVAGTHTPNMPMRNLAVSGYMLDNLKAQLPTVQSLISQVAEVGGRKAVVPIYIGTNDSAEIIASPSSYWARLKSQLLDVIVSYGGIPIIGTLCPNGGLPAYEAPRLSFNALVRADSYRYMDFGGDPVMGDLATCSGGVYYEADTLHFTTAGAALLAPIATAAIQAALA
ncbi:MAG TPA: SGNH/GDSL hydrolase family protein [Moraxellaceae bacterium]|nr:SGNH/GDSL hydrolase family protein [Moraxellaceae bacterium]